MIDFSNAAVLANAGVPIPIDTQAEYDAALNAAKQIYEARPGGVFDSGALNDLENRIRGGQTLEQIIANTYDDAMRRFPQRDMVNNERDSAFDIGRDAQLNLGTQFAIPANEIQRVITSAGITSTTAQAAAMSSRSMADIIAMQRPLSTQTVRPAGAGPSQAYYGGSATPMMAGFGGGGLSMGTILMLGGGALVLFLLLKGHKKGRH